MNRITHETRSKLQRYIDKYLVMLFFGLLITGCFVVSSIIRCVYLESKVEYFNPVEHKIIPIILAEPTYTLISGATISAYTASPEETDNDFCITADGTNICGTTENIVANNCLPFDTLIEYNNVVYRVADRMNKRYNCSTYDLLFTEKQDALNWGVKYNQTIKIL